MPLTGILFILLNLFEFFLVKMRKDLGKARNLSCGDQALIEFNTSIIKQL